jgi:hypothetical protein
LPPDRRLHQGRQWRAWRWLRSSVETGTYQQRLDSRNETTPMACCKPTTQVRPNPKADNGILACQYEEETCALVWKHIDRPFLWREFDSCSGHSMVR